MSGVWGGMALGAPRLGGLITDSLGWRWIFLVNVPLCAAVMLLAWLALRPSGPPDSRRALPVGRAILLAIAVAGLTAAPAASREVAAGLLVAGLWAGLAVARPGQPADLPGIPAETLAG